MANTAKRTPAKTDAKYAEEAWKAHELRVQGWPLRRIGQALGINKDTAQSRIDWANKQLLLPQVLDYRKIQNERLENLLALALDGIREPVMFEGVQAVAMDGTPVTRLNLERLDKARKLIDDLSNLHGVKAPVQVEHKMLEITPEDLELVEASNERARAYMAEHGWEVSE